MNLVQDELDLFLSIEPQFRPRFVDGSPGLLVERDALPLGKLGRKASFRH